MSVGENAMVSYVTGHKGGRSRSGGSAARRNPLTTPQLAAHNAPRAVAHTLIGKEKSPI